VSWEGSGLSRSGKVSIVVTDRTLVVRVNDKIVVEAKYTLDSKRTPPAIDLESQGQRTPGICELKGDTLRLCLGREMARPMQFAGSKDTMLLVLERAQAEAGGTPDRDEPESYSSANDNTGFVTAPVTYTDTMLIAVASEGVAAIVFGEPVERGRKYRFRFLKKGAAHETVGNGHVFERYTDGHYDGGKLTIRAGPIRIGWSAGDDDRGWVYYKPESMRVQIASAERFEDKDVTLGDEIVHREKLDLRRFLKQP
jgi:uncharacterized protein (TIGR03067 family)